MHLFGTTGPQNTLYAYNGRGLQTGVTHEETGTVNMAYDSVGNMTQRTDEASVVVDSFYDLSNRLTQREKRDRKSTRLNSSHTDISRMPSSA